MYMHKYRDESADPKWDAQRNLQGRTHYVDDDTLKFHHSRILEARIEANGLLFCLIESVALDMDNHSRGFRPVVFDIAGNVLTRASLEDCHKTRKAACKALCEALEGIDAIQATRTAIDSHERHTLAEIQRARAELLEVAA